MKKTITVELKSAHYVLIKQDKYFIVFNFKNHISNLIRQWDVWAVLYPVKSVLWGIEAAVCLKVWWRCALLKGQGVCIEEFHNLKHSTNN